ncbi:hypothetical protein OK016_25510 [Vibrio chagasii]|nr:hypothetical protein [Vibrio chagasii]
MNWNVSSSAGVYYQDAEQDSNSGDLSVSANHKNKYVDSNAYTYVNSNSSANVSAYLGTNNILTTEGVEFTSEKRRAILSQIMIRDNYRQKVNSWLWLTQSRMGNRAMLT